MTTGIYLLQFEGTDKVYIGQSLNIELRYISHKTALRCGKGSEKLQKAYQQYGMPNLKILLECEEHELDINETEAINVYDSALNGFNTMSSFGHRSQLKGDKAGNAKYSNEVIEETFFYLVDNIMTHREITEITGVPRGTLADISCGNTHTWLKDKYPDLYNNLMLLKGSLRKTSKNTSASRGIIYPDVLSPDGVVYKVEPSLRGFCKVHGLNHGSFGEVLRGFRKHAQGWTLVK